MLNALSARMVSIDAVLDLSELSNTIIHIDRATPMKTFRPIPLFAAATLGFSTLLSAQNEKPEAQPDEIVAVPEWKVNFDNLTDDQQAAYKKRLYEASRLFNQKRIIESLNEIAEAQKIFNEGPTALNLVGACYVEFRNFDKARIAFEEALKLQGDYLKDIAKVQGDARIRRMRPVVNVLFNLAEMDFVTSKWQACHDRIETILPHLDPKNASMSRLIEFKYMLCKIKLDRVEEARKLAEKYDYLDDYPFYYYANAAIDYFDGKERDAERWRTSARRVFRRTSVLAPWEDTMIEFGFVKSFYGGVDKTEK